MIDESHRWPLPSVSGDTGGCSKNIYIYTHYKLGQACDTNWSSFVLLHVGANVVTN